MYISYLLSSYDFVDDPLVDFTGFTYTRPFLLTSTIL